MKKFDKYRPYLLTFFTGYFLNSVVYGRPTLNSVVFLSAMALLLIFKATLWYLDRRDLKKQKVTPL